MLDSCFRVACWVGALLIAGYTVGHSGPSSAARADEPAAAKKPVFRPAGVRYQVKGVARSVAFYTQHLGFKVERQAGTAFASVSNGPLTLWLSGPGSSGSRPLPGGQVQTPGGWNRIALEVDDLQSRVAELKQAGLHFRNAIEAGPGGKQIQLEDPDGNPVELFEPAR
ncbi:MAG: VOC family protein [Actinomycetota bacterium]